MDAGLTLNRSISDSAQWNTTAQALCNAGPRVQRALYDGRLGVLDLPFFVHVSFS